MFSFFSKFHLINHPMAAGSSNPVAVPFREALSVWAKIGVLSFGGPAAQIALMHRIIVDEKKWFDEAHYLSALSFCMLLPGPEAMQLATYVGWRLHGLIGGLAAGLLFVLPGATVIFALSAIYASFGNVPILAAVFLGIKAAVSVIVVEALIRISKRALKLPEHWAIAGISFFAIFFLGAPFPLIVFAAALLGYIRSGGESTSTSVPLIAPSRTVATVAVWLLIWFVPLLGIAAFFGRDHVLTQMSWFFSKLAVVTFGGAYAVLAYMAQDVVARYGWLDAGTMMDGLGLAETTPGPLILVTEFVGYVSAYRQAGMASTVMGFLGAFVALWATFAPCFLWIFAGAPYLAWITGQSRLKRALAAITAAVVGVILNLAIWFGLHVLFKTVDLVTVGPLKLWTPEIATLDWRVVVLIGLSAWLLLRRHWGIPAVLVSSAGLATLMSFVH